MLRHSDGRLLYHCMGKQDGFGDDLVPTSDGYQTLQLPKKTTFLFLWNLYGGKICAPHTLCLHMSLRDKASYYVGDDAQRKHKNENYKDNNISIFA